MSEVVEEKKPEVIVEKKPVVDPFDDNVWKEETAIVEEKKPEKIEEKVEEKKPVIGADEMLSTETGWKSWDEAKAAKAELETLKTERDKNKITFADEKSEKYFNALKEGKEDEVYNYLAEKKRLERIEKMDVSKVEQAAEIIKTSLQYKYKDLTESEIDRMVTRKYPMPVKPVQTDLQDADEYAQVVKNWEAQVKEAEIDMIIDAKTMRPDLAQYKNNLALPDIPKKVPEEQKPSQESLDGLKAVRDKFLQNLESNYKNFEGFTTKVKDESVEFPVTFKVPDEDKLAIRNLMQDFNPDIYFQKRWVNKDGSVNINQMMSDLILLEKPDKVLQGTAGNAASQRLAQERKIKSNIKLDTTTQTKPVIEGEKSNKEKQVEAIWEA